MVEPRDVEEISEGDPAGLVVENARRKAAAVGSGEGLVLAADTVVVVDEAILGKPSGPTEARAFLELLSGRSHHVWTGLVLGERTAAVQTAVAFRDIESLIDWYLATGEWQGKAGGYAIQGKGAALVDYIVGDYNNVVGLPISALIDLAPDLL